MTTNYENWQLSDNPFGERKSAPFSKSAEQAQPVAPASDTDLLNWLENNPGFQIEKFITWRNGEDEYDGIERAYWQVTTNDDYEFNGSTLRAAIAAAASQETKE